MKAAISKYFLYILVYCYIFLLFLKGYYPANENGILFIGFMIFMILSYNFAGALISDELNARRQEIYHKFESLLDQQYQILSLIRKLYKNVSKYKNQTSISIKKFNIALGSEINTQAARGIEELYNYETTQLLSTILREQLGITKKYIQIAYILAARRLLKNKLNFKK